MGNSFTGIHPDRGVQSGAGPNLCDAARAGGEELQGRHPAAAGEGLSVLPAPCRPIQIRPPARGSSPATLIERVTLRLLVYKCILNRDKSSTYRTIVFLYPLYFPFAFPDAKMLTSLSHVHTGLLAESDIHRG